MRHAFALLLGGVTALTTFACGGDDGVTPPACPAPLTMCGDVCLDTRSDSQHCGDCTTACEAGEVCNGAGACELTCQDGLIECGGVCTDPLTSNQFCGASGDCTGASAGTACDAGEVCDGAGSCELTCQAGLIECGGVCTDPMTSNQHCGASDACAGATAGAVCPSGQVCTAGQCQITCGPGQLVCGGACVDPRSNNTYCGASGDCAGANDGNVCPAGQVCNGAGQCQLTCQQGLIACGGVCTSPTTSNQYCGATGDCAGANDGTVCPAGTVCTAGQCQLTCGPNQIVCGGACVDPRSNNTYCGASGNCAGANDGNVCPSGQVCNGAGQCQPTCQQGQIACGGACTDPQTSEQYCGATGDCAGANDGNICPSGSRCVAGQCQLSCQPGLISCNGTCTNPLTSNQFCGASGDCVGANDGNACAAGFVCNGAGACALTCQQGLVACNGTCIDPASNPTFCGASGNCAGANDGVDCADTEACVAGVCAPLQLYRTFLVNERSASRQHEWNPTTNSLTVFHQVQANDVDCNAAQGSPLVWFVEHNNDRFGNFVWGPGNATNATFGPTPYAYPKHVVVLGGSLYVMSRNDATIKRYSFAGAETGSLTTGLTTGQGLATDGVSLYASFWSGAVSSFRRYTPALVETGSFVNPTGMGGNNNVVDFVYDGVNGNWLGLVTTGEGGTNTSSNVVARFVMGGAVLNTIVLGVQSDGIGLNACP